MDSSSTFSPCRIDWRPSRWLSLALVALGLLAALAVCLSALPVWLKLPGALAVLAFGAWLARREARRPGIEFVWPGGDAPATLLRSNGTEETVAVHGIACRGGIVAVILRDADRRRRRLVWWPDTLDAKGRRTLRLAAALRTRTDLLLPFVAG